MKKFIMRGIHFLQRINRESKSFTKNKRNFGLRIAWCIFVDGIFPPGKTEKYISSIEKYVSDYLSPLVSEYQNQSYIMQEKMVTPLSKVPVWCCWWQGSDKMPEIVKMCNERLKMVLPDEAELHLITESNYAKYVSFPDHIMSKFLAGKMSITAFSDILRVTLLAKYGGFWIDSTVLVSGQLPKQFINSSFFTQKMYDPVKWKREACKGRWCGFMMAGCKDNIIFRFLRDAYFQWWKDYDTVIDYVILDYFLLAAYHKIYPVKAQIDKVPNNNEDVFEMYKVLHQPYSKELFITLTENTVMHKLTYKINLVKKTNKGEDTLYQHLLKCVNEQRDFL